MTGGDYTPRIAYDQHMAEQYDQHAFIWRIYIPLLRSTIEQKSYSSLLDLGCGTGSLLMEIYSLLENGHGLDISPWMISQARRKVNDLSVKNVTFEVCKIQRIKSDRKYDLVTSTDGVMSYLQGEGELEDLIGRIKGLLKQHGMMILEFWTPEANPVPKSGEREFPSEVSALSAQELEAPFICTVTEIPSAHFTRYSFYCENKPYSFTVMKSPTNEAVHRYYYFDPEKVKKILSVFGFATVSEYGVNRQEGESKMVPYVAGSKIWVVVVKRK